MRTNKYFHWKIRPQFSMRSSFIFLAICSIIALFSEKYFREIQVTYFVNPIEAQYRGGWEFAQASSAIAFQSSHSPTFIFHGAISKMVPYLDGQNIPYMVVVHNYESEVNLVSDFNVDSKDLDVSVLTKVDTDGQVLVLRYSLKLSYHQNSSTFEIIESLTINEQEIDFNKGRVIEISFQNNAIQIEQRISNLESAQFRARPYKGSGDRERVQPILNWWRRLNNASVR